MRDSGLDISYTLRQGAIDQKRASFINATENNFAVGSYKHDLTDVVINLTDKNHTSVVNAFIPLMKQERPYLTHTDSISLKKD